ncbi:SigE family RNA polymerase sigma factor [Streptacidiphilus sp. PAMC 29251]
MAHASRRESGFAAFAAECRTPLLRTAVLLTGAQESAERLVLAALVQAYLHWDRFAEGGSPHLYTHEAMLRGYTRRWCRRAVAGRERPEGARAGLSRREWAALVLRRHEGLPDDRIARTLGCGIEEVRRACGGEYALPAGRAVQERPFDLPALLARGRRRRYWRDGTRAVGLLVLLVGCGVAAAGVAGAAVRCG